MVRQLADRRGLAGAVDAGDHHDQRLGGVDVHRLFQRQEQFDEQRAQCQPDLLAVIDAFAPHALAQLIQQPLRCRHAGIAGQQRHLQLFEQGIVDLDVREQAGQIAARARHAGAQAAEPAAPFGFRQGNEFVSGRQDDTSGRRQDRLRVQTTRRGGHGTGIVFIGCGSGAGGGRRRHRFEGRRGDRRNDIRRGKRSDGLRCDIGFRYRHGRRAGGFRGRCILRLNRW